MQGCTPYCNIGKAPFLTFFQKNAKKQGKNLDVIIKWFYICNDFRNEVQANTKTEVK